MYVLYCTICFLFIEQPVSFNKMLQMLMWLVMLNWHKYSIIYGLNK